MRVHVSHDRIAATVESLAARMAAMAGRPILLLPLLTGATVFVADLLRRLPPSTRVRPLVVEYGRVLHVPARAPRFATFAPWLVDACVQSGASLLAARAALEGHRLRGLKAVALFGVPPAPGSARRFAPDLVGEELATANVAGYGMDDGETLRGLPDVVEIGGAT